jgi:hypothetical protein
MDEHSLTFFVGLESRVWDALVRGDVAADRALLAADFVGVYATGFADRNDHVGQLAAGPTVASYAIDEARLLRISDTSVMLTYRADFRRLRSGVPGETEAMYVSSLWSEQDGQWLNVFSQDTAASSR